MQHSIKLLQVKDPLFKRMGASRLSRFAIDGMFTCYFFYLQGQFLLPFFSQLMQFLMSSLFIEVQE